MPSISLRGVLLEVGPHPSVAIDREEESERI